MSHARAEIVVDLGAIRANVRLLRELAGPGTAMMTVIKADGYGHGILQSAQAARAGGAEWLGVATLDEALAVRDAGDTGRMLSWLAVPGEDYAAAIEHDIDVTAYTTTELDEIVAAAQSTDRVARVQLKVDTGLSRGGSTIDSWPDLVEAAHEAEVAGTVTVSGIWSHFACSDQPDHPANDLQEHNFRAALDVADRVGLQPEVRHLSNSAAAILRPSAQFDLVRCGIASYGLDPAPGLTEHVGLTPAMTVRAELAVAKRIHKGDGVSYGHTWIADRDTNVGVVPGRLWRGRPSPRQQHRRGMDRRPTKAGSWPDLHGPVRRRPRRG